MYLMVYLDRVKKKLSTVRFELYNVRLEIMLMGEILYLTQVSL